jgi:surface antigen
MLPVLPARSSDPVLFAFAMLALGACADQNDSIKWDSGRVEPGTTAPAAPEPTAPAPPSTGAVPPATEPSAAATAPPPDPCREYRETVIIGGRRQPVYGRACPQPDGTWRTGTPSNAPVQ